MPRPYSEDLRERLIAAVEAGSSPSSAANAQIALTVSLSAEPASWLV
jgi:hypothetical protein